MLSPLDWLFEPGSSGKLSAIQETGTGRCFRCLHAPRPLGQIFRVTINVKSEPARATLDQPIAEMNFKVLERVHPNSLYALLRRYGVNRRLARGHWYQVHGD